MIKSRRHPHQQPDEASQDRFLKILAYALVVLLAGIPFAMGKYLEFHQPDPFDSAIYVYSAEHILQGARIGVDEIPSANIGTLLVNMLGVAVCGFNEIGPKVIQGLLQVGALVLMFLALRRLFGTLGASISVILASLYLSAPMIAKFGNVKEQHMIAFMIMGMSCFVLYQLSGKWWQAMLAGALVSWAPLFKQTGVSAVAALGLFVLAQPLLRRQTVRQAARDMGLLLAGAAAALAPLYIWIMGFGVKMPLPYNWVGMVFARLLPAAGGAADPNAAGGDYISSSRQVVTLAEQARMVFRYYGVLALPIVLSLVSIGVRLARWVLQVKTRSASAAYDRFVLLFGTWWVLDMAFVWVSPRPYEQYYLPLNGSAAMLAGYGVAVYWDKLRSAVFRKEAWAALGAVGLVLMVWLAWPILAGTKTSPATGADYGKRSRGYVQKLDEISQRVESGGALPFESAADYIRDHSTAEDRIYVWGWIPGIYIRAQRFSSAPVACTSEMHVYPPATLSKVVADLLEVFEKEPVLYIVDTHNSHFPYDGRPPLELWPVIPNKGFLGLAWADRPMLLPADQAKVQEYEARYTQALSTPRRPDHPDQARWPDEAARFAAMKPLRDYVMQHYQVDQVVGPYVILRRKAPASGQGR